MGEYDESDDDVSISDEQRSDSEWAKLRRAEKAKKQAITEAENAKRELAFYKAGISPDDPKASYFIKGYDGDLDPEKIRAAATEAGFISPAVQEEAVDDSSVKADARINDAAGGAVEVDTALNDIVASFRESGMEGLIASLKSAGATVNDVQ